MIIFIHFYFITDFFLFYKKKENQSKIFKVKNIAFPYVLQWQKKQKKHCHDGEFHYEMVLWYWNC